MQKTVSKEYNILDKEIKVPVLQGGMGLGISLGSLAGHVAKEGAMGTISMVAPGYKEEDFLTNKSQANKRGFLKELNKARKIAGSSGMIGVNVMYALTDYEDLVRLADSAGVDYIIVGAGLPLNLPDLVKRETKIAPIVSSVRALNTLLKVWKRRYDRVPDFIVVEGVGAGGHLGFSSIDEDFDLLSLTEEISTSLKDKKLDIPIFVAGSADRGYDLDQYRKAGAFGIQVGTRFLASVEADCHPNLKEMIVKSSSEDLVVFDSPVGMKGRGIYNDLLKSIEKERRPSQRCINCIKTCKPDTTTFCIYDALKAAALGDTENGLVFAGSRIDSINEILTVKEILDSIKKEYQEQ